ncbi:LL-diaminopimelate aminotransferase [Tritonibacter multivorans]|uniref:LL-diaminopimelate aminotransferase n=1 Tax=Tritonibacter multivorans TaxID=928856 RepID=A0A0P1GD82_9RHOB|nr:aminotransferase class I/II-fold pyridoxal phosphate-dependent enzyme [Tritonibacter multivorans]MDA7419916.1 aminotransferase class I/II-fold pyridoxal phosphate-dependent enzyme [Tritonibacter multivorans]CUH79314.1 LL-diaminopimelate aminotransferase [Tritonibacter multivorans]SFC11882.1 Aspartate/methionine/tyrosine aminotransferase [Tritonibacter multivorans]
MKFPERFASLPPYAFPRLRALLDPLAPGGDVVQLTIGEPKHKFPDWVTQVIMDNAAGFNNYPPNDGSDELRGAISDWIAGRYGVTLDPATRVMALNGTREGLYNAAMALCPEEKGGQKPVVLIPNPFYQVYMIGAISVAADPVFVPATAATGHLPDYASLPDDVLNRTAVAYICSPANPQGAVASREYWAELIQLAEKYDFKIFADECYSEIYRDVAPTGALTVADELGCDPERVVLFNSLSKRSNLPGLRSGLIAGGPETIKQVKKLRAYSGAPLPSPLQAAAAKVWADEDHVIANREMYQEKYRIADEVFAGLNGYMAPEAGFFLWLPVEDGEAATTKLWTETGIKVLPGAYLAQGEGAENPGHGFIRVALVADADQTRSALTTLRSCLY